MGRRRGPLRWDRRIRGRYVLLFCSRRTVNETSMTLVRNIALILACLVLLNLGGCRDGEIPKERYLDIDAGGTRLHMLLVGEAEPVVVLESGWPGCGLGWDRVRGPVAQ